MNFSTPSPSIPAPIGAATPESLLAWGSPFEWRGLPGRQGVVASCDCRIVPPDIPAQGNPWIWKPEFLDAFTSADEALVGRGAWLVHLDLPDHYGCPAAVERMNAAYADLTGRFGLAAKVGILALSRGGLWAYNWAAQNLGRVACIYADNPVCDFKSWPGGKGIGPGSASDWTKCLSAYGFTEEQALAFRGNPVDHAELIARHAIPVLHVIGDADQIVPVSENTTRVRDIMRATGGDYREIVKCGALHHPHGLACPAPIVAFFEQYLLNPRSLPA